MTRNLRIILFVVVMLNCSMTNAQQSAAEDSLLSKIKLSQNDTSLWRHYNKLSSIQYNSNQYQKAYESGLEVVKAAQATNNKLGISYGYQAIAMALEKLGKYKESEDNFLKALNLRENIGDQKLIAATCHNLGSLLNLKGDSEAALKYHLRALSIREELRDSANLPSSYNSIALIQHDLRNYNVAIEYYNKAIKISEAKSNKRSQAVSYNNIGMVYRQTGNFDVAIGYYKKAIELNKEINNKDFLGRNYDEMSRLYVQMADSGSGSNPAESKRLLGIAAEYCQTSIDLLQKHGSKSSLGHAYKSLGYIYFKMDSIRSAEEYYLRALTILTETATLKYLKDVYLDLSKLYEKEATINNLTVMSRDSALIKSLVYYKKYHELTDSLINQSRLSSIAKISAQYETEKKDNEIKLLNKENELKSAGLKQRDYELQLANLEKEKNQNEIALLNKDNDLQSLQLIKSQQEAANRKLQTEAKAAELELEKKDKALKEKQLSEEKLYRNLIIVGALSLIVFGMLLFNRFRLRKQLESQMALTSQRKQISADLHDDIGATLSSISIYSEAMKNKYNQGDHTKAMQLAEKIGTNSREMMDNMSDIVWTISPGQDTLQQIVDRMVAFATGMLAEKNIKCRFDYSENNFSVLIPMDARKNIYLIFKEAINNIAKYSQCSNVNVEIKIADSWLMLKITDDGKGFDASSEHEYAGQAALQTGRNLGGNGIKNMQQRAEEINAQFTLKSGSNKGTTLELKYPLVRG